MDTGRLVRIGGVALWAILTVLSLVTGNHLYLYAAIVVIVLQVVLATSLRR